MDYLNDIPKYKKKKKSNVSQVSKKSKHKHIYRDVIIRYHYVYGNIDYNGLTFGQQCIVCNKVNNCDILFPQQKNEDGTYRDLTEKELLEMHKNGVPLIDYEGLL